MRGKGQSAHYMMMMIHSICMVPYICLKKHSKARAPPKKLAFKCLKKDVSFEWSFEVVKVVNFANRWWEGIPQARSNRGQCPISISLEMSNGHLESEVRWAKIYAKIACDRVFSRTDWLIPAKLRSCMYLAEPMKWLDFGVSRSKVTAHYVCINSSWSYH